MSAHTVGIRGSARTPREACDACAGCEFYCAASERALYGAGPAHAVRHWCESPDDALCQWTDEEEERHEEAH